MDTRSPESRYFVSYSGVKLPLNLVNELTDLDNRNTYFRGVYDSLNRLIRCEKLVYGEIELLHEYEYHDDGSLRRAEISDADGEVTELTFEAKGEVG